MENILNRQFSGQAYRNVVVSYLTYVRVGKCWNNICVLVDLSNREIVGYSAVEHKTAGLVRQTFISVERSLWISIYSIQTVRMSLKPDDRGALGNIWDTKILEP